MKFCLKSILVVVLILQLTGVRVGTCYVAPKDIPDSGFVVGIDVDQQHGTYTAHRYYDYAFRDGPIRHEIPDVPAPAQKKIKLTFHQKAFQKSEGISPETLAAAIISIDRGRYHNSMTRIVGSIQRGRDPAQAINALNRIRHMNDQALATMPVVQVPEQVTLHYFRLESRLFSPEQLVMEYQRKGFVPDPQVQIADNEQDPSLAHDYPNATQWILANGSAYSLTFDENSVSCDRCNAWVGSDWWFAGVKRS